VSLKQKAERCGERQIDERTFKKYLLSALTWVHEKGNNGNEPKKEKYGILSTRIFSFLTPSHSDIVYCCSDIV